MPSVHSHTPSLTVIDSRGLAVRQVNFYRSVADSQPAPRVHAQHFDACGRPVAAWDPRLFALYDDNPATLANVTTIHSLSGEVLASHSVDAGFAVSLLAESGVVLERWDARQTQWQNVYDGLLRLSAIREKMREQAWRVSERFSYGGNDAVAAGNNLCGRLTRIDDEAGTQAIIACNLSGAVLQESRRLIKDAHLPNWPETLSERDALLEPHPAAMTHHHYGAEGTATGLTDARGNRQNIRLNISGQPAQVNLKLCNGNEQVLLADTQYNALGQIQTQTAGNGVVSLYTYCEADGRLQTLTTQRAANDPLQRLAYRYDPAGNVSSIADDAQPTRHFSNQRIEPVNHYVYDSLYQLIEASGRETANAVNGPQLPPLLALPLDSSQWLNYTERYGYDSAGNLLQLRHEGARSFTRNMQVDATSNRALLREDGDGLPDFDQAFDAGGNQQDLTAGQSLLWSAQNRLSQVNAVTRTDSENDAERYTYDSSGQRLRKTATALVRMGSHTREVRYMPGLEVRSDSATGEELEVIVVQAGRCAVRCLHWVSGRPSGVENDQLRYSVDDHLGSSTLELDTHAHLISHEGYYPYGGTAWWAARSDSEAKYKVVRYSGKERDASGLYYYGLRYYAPWLMRWMSPDPGGIVDGLNLYQMVRNNPINRIDQQGADSEHVFGLTDNQFYLVLGTVITLIAVVLGAIRTAGNREETTADTPISASHQFVFGHEAQYSLTFSEGMEVVRYMQAHNLEPKHMKFHENLKGDLFVFGLKSPRSHDEFEKNKNKYKNYMPTNLPNIQIRQGLSLEDLEQRRGSVPLLPAASTSTPSFEVFTQPQPGRRKSSSLSKKSSSINTSTTGQAPSIKPPEAKITPARVVDIGDFFSSKEFSNAQKEFPLVDLEHLVKEVISRYVDANEGSPHLVKLSSKTVPELSLDLPIPGSRGRGKWRLLLMRVNNTGPWKPHRIGDTH